MDEVQELEFRSGVVAIIGRPNVGKSTLLNKILGQKISITSDRPQTTRHLIRGIKTEPNYQIVFVDTPGLHLHGKRAMNRYLNRAARGSLEGVDAILWLTDSLRWTEEDDNIVGILRDSSLPIIMAINKIDALDNQQKLLPMLQERSSHLQCLHCVPISAQSGEGLELLESLLATLMPVGPSMYPEDQVTDKTERFLAAEVIREKLMRRLSQELPYAVTVVIEQFKEEAKLLRISGLIWVERDSQKAIVIGKDGAGLKAVGRAARLELEKTFEKKIFLQLWVKVKEGWSEDERMLNSLGYETEEN